MERPGQMQKSLLTLAILSLGLGHDTADTIRIGHAGPLTGPLAHIGKDGENGARLAMTTECLGSAGQQRLDPIDLIYTI